MDNMLATTFVMIKPDGVRAAIVGDVIGRFERSGLTIVAARVLSGSHEAMDGFYPQDDAWVARLGHKTLATYTKLGLDATSELATDDPLEIGRLVRSWLIDYMTSGPVVLLAVRGHLAVEAVRKLVGPTMPIDAPPGTIRGDYSTDSAAVANRAHRAVMNLVHATETAEEAARELIYWFDPEELG